MRWYALMVVVAFGLLIVADDQKKPSRKGQGRDGRALLAQPVALAGDGW